MHAKAFVELLSAEDFFAAAVF